MKTFFLAVFCFFLPLKVWAATLLFSDGLESGNVASGWDLTTDSSHYSPNTAETVIVTSPVHSGTYALHYYTLSGTNEHTPAQVGMDSTQLNAIFGTTNPSEIYIEWYEYYDSAYCFPNISQKDLRIGYDDEGAHLESRKEYNFVTQTTNSDLNIQCFCGFAGNTTACDVDFAEHTDEAHPLNEWVKWGAWLKLNTPGSSDGFMKIYKNGTLYIDSGNRNMRGTDTRGVNFFWLGGNYSGTLSCSGHRYYDDFKIYDTFPTATVATVPAVLQASDI